jgi:tetratricopeptide (TPR) repeat protein
VRIHAQLVDGQDGTQLWTARFDREVEDVFEIQDEIADQIAGTLEPTLARIDGVRLHRRPVESLDAWACVRRGIQEFYALSPEGLARARALFRRALEIEPDDSEAHCYLAVSFANAIVYGLTDDPQREIAEGLPIARRAVELDPDHATAQLAFGGLLLFRGQRREALARLRRAVELNPTSSLICWSLGASLIHPSTLDEALALLARAVRLSPQDSQLFLYRGNLALALMLAGRHAEALVEVRGSLAAEPAQGLSFRPLEPACLGLLGQIEAGRRALASLRALRPVASLDAYRRLVPRPVWDVFAEGMLRVGWDAPQPRGA